ncbi:HTH_Tnp_Tc3_2 domain-containing protein [Trichonephila clavipes]|uniref:HTH_Tnp_Tc3_2 domain-containing protein n=1 Tax=Trichonephila clavipes TaxID=2585209 RepID=A0A8X6S266_TRICX|nr:HTH_Tnp_Tc3_2 domain-containing protein [Trichonephila clavipes]
MAVSRIWNRWVQDGNTLRRFGSKRPHITSSGEDRHVTRMVLMERALSQDLGSFARQQLSAGIVCQRLQQHGLSTWRPCQRLH